MNISRIEVISNYRNLSGICINFNKNLNFLVGENNIGKTNILELLYKIFSTGVFIESDFCDILKPIKVEFTLNYTDDELGFFENNFDIDYKNTLTIIAQQTSIDSRIEYKHKGTEIIIKPNIIRKLNVLYYAAQRMPSKEFDLQRNNNTSKLLNYIVKKSIDSVNVNHTVNISEVSKVTDEINILLEKLNSVSGDNILAYLNNNEKDLIFRMIEIGSCNYKEFSLLGEGIQYYFSILFQILENIYNIKKTKTDEAFEERLLIINQKRMFPMFILLDEPEIHQHPYRQRTIIKKITDIINNMDVDFLEVLKNLFDIDGLIGQVFIATHSPNILLNNYKEFIRIYKNIHGDLEIISGVDIDLDDKLFKHLLRNLIYLKEAMFSRQVVFVEGDTENGAIPVFANREQLDLDEKSISVIKLDGADSIKFCVKLYSLFGIRCIAIIDADKKDNYDKISGIYFTKYNDYEEDVYNEFDLNDYLMFLKSIGKLNSFIPIIKSFDDSLNVKEFIENPLILKIDDDQKKEIMLTKKDNELKFLRSEKNTVKGSKLAKYVTNIPESFQNIINELKNNG